MSRNFFEKLFLFPEVKRRDFGQLIVEVTKSRTVRHTQPAGRLWTGDQRVADATTCITHNKLNKSKLIPSAGFEPAIPAIKWPQKDALIRAATWIQIHISSIKT